MWYSVLGIRSGCLTCKKQINITRGGLTIQAYEQCTVGQSDRWQMFRLVFEVPVAFYVEKNVQDVEEKLLLLFKVLTKKTKQDWNVRKQSSEKENTMPVKRKNNTKNATVKKEKRLSPMKCVLCQVLLEYSTKRCFFWKSLYLVIFHSVQLWICSEWNTSKWHPV